MLLERMRALKLKCTWWYRGRGYQMLPHHRMTAQPVRIELLGEYQSAWDTNPQTNSSFETWKPQHSGELAAKD